MPELNDLNADSPAKLSRRNVVVGTAWAVPAIALVGAAPAMAATGDTIAITGVSVSPVATGGAQVPSRTINAATPTNATVTVTGTATAGVQVYVTTGSYNSPSVTATGGNWSVTIPATEVSTWADGTRTFVATVVVGNKPSDTSPLTVLKDTVSPTLTFAGLSPNSSGNAGTMSGNKSADVTTVAVVATGVTLTGSTSYTTTTWSRAWTAQNSNTPWTVTLNASDTAGNPAAEVQASGTKTK